MLQLMSTLWNFDCCHDYLQDISIGKKREADAHFVWIPQMSSSTLWFYLCYFIWWWRRGPNFDPTVLESLLMSRCLWSGRKQLRVFFFSWHLIYSRHSHTTLKKRRWNCRKRWTVSNIKLPTRLIHHANTSALFRPWLVHVCVSGRGCWIPPSTHFHTLYPEEFYNTGGSHEV